MKTVLISVSAFLSIITLAVVACDVNKKPSAKNDGTGFIDINEDSLVKRGAYLVTIMGCNDCHSPKKMGADGPVPDEEKLLSGHPANMPLGKINTEELKSWVLFNPIQTATVGPWGVSFAANITSDKTGIGGWSEQQFFRAIRQGKYKGLEQSRQLLPPMPWPTYAKASDEDMRAVFYYLKSTKPVNNIVPSPIAPDRLTAKK